MPKPIGKTTIRINGQLYTKGDLEALLPKKKARRRAA